MKQNYARVYQGRVTHLAQVQPNWIDENPWTDVPGEWISAPNGVNTEWRYSTETNTFSPPVD
jgi:hypothetical protein